jgi:hypothetical protein
VCDGLADAAAGRGPGRASHPGGCAWGGDRPRAERGRARKDPSEETGESRVSSAPPTCSTRYLVIRWERGERRRRAFERRRARRATPVESPERPGGSPRWPNGRWLPPPAQPRQPHCAHRHWGGAMRWHEAEWSGRIGGCRLPTTAGAGPSGASDACPSSLAVAATASAACACSCAEAALAGLGGCA